MVKVVKRVKVKVRERIKTIKVKGKIKIKIKVSLAPGPEVRNIALFQTALQTNCVTVTIDMGLLLGIV